MSTNPLAALLALASDMENRSRPTLGQRIIAFTHATKDAVYVLGRGVYMGDAIPPYIQVPTLDQVRQNVPSVAHLTDEQLKPIVDRAAQASLYSYRYDLDNGETVWSNECESGPGAIEPENPASFETWCGERKIINVRFVRNQQGIPVKVVDEQGNEVTTVEYRPRITQPATGVAVA